MHLRKTTVLFAFLWLLAWSFAGAAPAQEKAPMGPGAALYNPQTVETVSGLVVAVSQPAAAEGGLPERVSLTLKTDRETIPVFLGPSSYLHQQGVKLAALDRIEVKGSRITHRGKPALIAAQVKKGDQVLKLRDDQGVPLWSGQKRPSQGLPESRKVYPQGQGLYWPGRTDNR